MVFNHGNLQFYRLHRIFDPGPFSETGHNGNQHREDLTMPKDEILQRIEGYFGEVGLGNADPERIMELREAYEHAMAQADLLKNLKKRKGKKFKDVLESAKDEPGQEDS